MRTQELAPALSLFLALAACAPARVAVRAPVTPAPKKNSQPAPRPTPADQQAIDQLYYQAVSAYTHNDLNAAGQFLGEIFKLAPAYAPAKELKEKLRLAAPKR